jgi:hypothetical protein
MRHCRDTHEQRSSGPAPPAIRRDPPTGTIVWVHDDDLLTRIQELRQQGSSPKQIAKALGLRPSAVAPLVREVAARQQAHAAPADRALIGCWVNPGWSIGLGLDDIPEWAPTEIEAKSDREGLVQVMVARHERASRAAVCTYLVDVYCLGVKNAQGPLVLASGSVETYCREFFGAFDVPPVAVPVTLAQQLVHGAVAFAKSLGFEPAVDFTDTAPYLGGDPTAASPIRFGRDGKPFYISGPYDNPRAVVQTLETSVGAGNYDYLAHIGDVAR